LSKNTYDTGFQAFMHRTIAKVLANSAPAVLAKPLLAELPVAVPMALLVAELAPASAI
jgi:hypothetical protein